MNPLSEELARYLEIVGREYASSCQRSIDWTNAPMALPVSRV